MFAILLRLMLLLSCAVIGQNQFGHVRGSMPHLQLGWRYIAVATVSMLLHRRCTPCFPQRRRCSARGLPSVAERRREVRTPVYIWQRFDHWLSVRVLTHVELLVLFRYLSHRQPTHDATMGLPRRPELEVSSLPMLVFGHLIGRWSMKSSSISCVSTLGSRQQPCLMAQPFPSEFGPQAQPQFLLFGLRQQLRPQSW